MTGGAARRHRRGRAGRVGGCGGLRIPLAQFRGSGGGGGAVEQALVRHYVPLLLGETRSQTPRSPEHAAAWTLDYPTEALVPVAATVETAALTDYRTATAPALFLFSDTDQIADPEATRDVAARCGGEATLRPLSPGLRTIRRRMRWQGGSSAHRLRRR